MNGRNKKGYKDTTRDIQKTNYVKHKSEFSKFGNKNLTQEQQIRIMIQAQQKKNEKRQMTDQDRAEIDT